MRVEDRLRQAVAPDEDAARERARERLRDEFERAGAGAPAGGRNRGRLAAAAVAAALVLVAALTPPGEAVADWVRAAVGLRPEIQLPTDGTPRSDRPPSGGRLLVAASGS